METSFCFVTGLSPGETSTRSIRPHWISVVIMNRLIIVLTALLIASAPVAAQTLPRFIIMTEEWVPYQFDEGPELRGIAVDLMVELLERTGSSQTRKDIQLFPWARAYRDLQKKKNTVLFSMTRTPERENLFRWVGPIFQNTTYLIASKKQSIKISSPEDLHKYRFGTIRDDASEMFLLRLGLTMDRFTRISNSQSNLRMLNAGRVDFIVSGWEAFVSDSDSTGLNQNDFEIVYTVDSSDVSIAFHRDTPDWIIQSFQQALDDIKAEGLYDRILEKYKDFMRDE